MARPATATRTGTLETCRDAKGGTYYRGKVRLQDGSLARVDIPERFIRSKVLAREYVTEEQRLEDEGHALYLAKLAKQTAAEATIAGAAGETCSAWYERFMTYRRQEVGSVDDDRRRWTKWIAPHIGPKPIALVTADDIENIRDALTTAVLAYEAAECVKGEGHLSPKSAQNIWTALTTAFKYAATRKGPRELRVREPQGNPCLGIPPPRDGVSKRRHWCRPGEIAALLACPDVPLAWREAIAVGCYLHLRPGELHELRIKDLDVSAGEVRIRRAWDERTKTVTTPKTDEGVRTVTVPSSLLPLLARLERERKAEDLVAPIVAATPEKSTASRAILFRTFLAKAGVTRAEMFVETTTHLMIDFRSGLRDSGITWRFLAGERSEVIQREAGHEHISTTLGYAKEVQDRRGRYGEPFPALPADLVEPPLPTDQVPVQGDAKYAEKGWAERGLNPRPTD